MAKEQTALSARGEPPRGSSSVGVPLSVVPPGWRMLVTAVVVAGPGYVGLPPAMRAAAVGHGVTSYDTDPVRVKRLEACESRVEDVPSSELAATLDSGRFLAPARADASGPNIEIL